MHPELATAANWLANQHFSPKSSRTCWSPFSGGQRESARSPTTFGTLPAWHQEFNHPPGQLNSPANKQKIIRILSKIGRSNRRAALSIKLSQLWSVREPVNIRNADCYCWQVESHSVDRPDEMSQTHHKAEYPVRPRWFWWAPPGSSPRQGLRWLLRFVKNWVSGDFLTPLIMRTDSSACRPIWSVNPG